VVPDDWWLPSRKPGKIEKAFGQALREARTQADMSQEKLGLESGYDTSYISQLESGLYSPSLRTIFSLAKVHVNPVALIDRTDAISERKG
jgi:transcriptional regulator with XRE-family HTH domain